MSSSSSSDAPSPLDASSLRTSLPLEDNPTWLTRLYKDDEFEEHYNTPMAVQLMPMDVRDILWAFSREVIGRKRAQDGVTSQACRLFERFCSVVIAQYETLSMSEWELKRLDLKVRTPLLLAVCLMLATKMESSQNYITATAMRLIFLKRGREFTMQDINLAEAEVFRTVEFRIPMWTNVAKAHTFVVSLGCSSRTVLAAGMLMDLVDSQLPLLIDRLRLQASSTTSSSSGAGPSPIARHEVVNIRSLHLLAGVVLAAIRFMRTPEPDLTPTVARWTRAPVDYVRWIGNVIYHFLIDHIVEKEKKSVKRSLQDEAIKCKTKRHCHQEANQD